MYRFETILTRGVWDGIPNGAINKREPEGFILQALFFVNSVKVNSDLV